MDDSNNNSDITDTTDTTDINSSEPVQEPAVPPQDQQAPSAPQEELAPPPASTESFGETKQDQPAPVVGSEPTETPVEEPTQPTEQAPPLQKQQAPPSSTTEFGTSAGQSKKSYMAGLLQKLNAKIFARRQMRLQKIIDLANKKKKIDVGDVRELLIVSDSTALRYLNQLVGEGKLKRSGQSVEAKYEPI